MYLKSISLKGFKSFASATNLNFERGITCVVGPNGSGKSNVVDALSWVMGEQGAKSLRGGKMEDVIFAGTSGRAPLGRAEVSVTIDNTDGALPIEFTEVTITRILFRNGSSEYQINGTAARLLDIQELLSDSGIGREMHVIVGQGQLDAILLANPEERRAFIEEAAGVLKHRKRKEKALRKLEAMSGNLDRIQDLTVELRRQLKPLGKQAEVARKAGLIQSDLRDARLRLLADELLSQRQNFAAEVADETSLKVRRDGVELSLHTARAREEELEALSAAENPQLVNAQESYYKLTAQRERFRGVASLSAERYRLLTQEAESVLSSGRDPEAMEAEAAVLRSEENELRAEFDSARNNLNTATTSRSDYEKQLVEQQRSLSSALAQAASAREAKAREEGRVSSLRSKLEAVNAEISRLGARQEESEQSLGRAKEEYALLESELAVAGADEGGIGKAHLAARELLTEKRGEVENLAGAESAAAKSVASLSSRLATLQESLSIKDGSELIGGQANVLGKLADLIEVERGFELAVSAALGQHATALVVSNLDDALGAIALLKAQSGGQSQLLVLSGAVETNLKPDSLAHKVRAGSGAAALVNALLADFVFAADTDAAKSILRQGGIAVTSEGDVIGKSSVRGGSQGGRSLIEIKALIEETSQRLEAAKSEAVSVTEALRLGKERLAAATSEFEVASATVSAADAALAALSAKFAAAGQAVKTATSEVERVTRQLGEANGQAGKLAQDLSAAESALSARELPDEPDATGVDQLRSALEIARTSEVDAKLHLRTIEERANALAVRAKSLETTAANERESAARAIVRREQQKKAAEIAKETGEAAAAALALIEVAVSEALALRGGLEQARAARDGELLEVRAASRELAKELDQLTSSVHKDEVMRAEQRLRIEQLEARSLEEFGIEADALIAEYGPANDVPTHIEDEFGNFVPGELIPFRREQQAKRLAVAEKELALLGKINPLALEEYSALEERLKYLAEQLEDLKKTRKDLLEIVREVDEKVQEVFTQAYADTAREFESIFKRLFPGGDGRLILTDPNDMTITGVDVEARPPGKRVKRLSLLSGGERSLVAVAMLVAIFKARPSPFYVMDEVEAALDDTNLSRLLGVFEELREKSQLIVITHQKRTMEIADALYGVTMRGDGVSEVISQRLRESDN